MWYQTGDGSGALMNLKEVPKWKPNRPLPYIGGRWLHQRLPIWLRHILWVPWVGVVDPLNYIDHSLSDHDKCAEILRVPAT